MSPAAIRELRDRMGWTQPVLGALVGVNAVCISRWELGHAAPTHFQGQLLDAFHQAAEKDLSVGARVAELVAARNHVGALAAVLSTAQR